MSRDALRVLCVADDSTQLELLERAFGRRPAVSVATATSGAAALSTLAESPVHCVVCTDAIGDESGLGLLDGVRESHTELPFVLFAAEGDERLASEATGRGATDYLRRSGTNPYELLVDRAVGYARSYRERAALERVRERYELAGRVVSDVVWERDLDTGAVRWSAGVEDMLGYDREGSHDRGWWLERVHPDDRAAVEEAWGSAEAGEVDAFECRYRFQRADGSYASVVDGGEVVRSDGRPVRLVGALRDVSERLERTAELERRNEQLDAFTTVVSHDLRNPLNVARGRVELARETGDVEHLDDATTSLDRMSDLIADLLALAREGQAIDELEPVALGPLVEDAWATVPDRDAAGATLSVETDCRVLADPARLRQLLENLLANAVEHGSTSPRSQAHEDAVEHGSTSPASQARQDAVEHGSTGSRTQSDDAGSCASEPSVANAPEDAVEHGSTSSRPQADDAVEHATGGDSVADELAPAEGLVVHVGRLEAPDADGFYVADDGCGIPDAERASVFDLGHSEDEAGDGVGLAIVEEIATAHGWSVHVVDSERGGARFEVRGVAVPDGSAS